jgi:hypothetical protein
MHEFRRKTIITVPSISKTLPKCQKMDRLRHIETYSYDSQLLPTKVFCINDDFILFMLNVTQHYLYTGGVK